MTSSSCSTNRPSKFPRRRCPSQTPRQDNGLIAQLRTRRKASRGQRFDSSWLHHAFLGNRLFRRSAENSRLFRILDDITPADCRLWRAKRGLCRGFAPPSLPTATCFLVGERRIGSPALPARRSLRSLRRRELRSYEPQAKDAGRALIPRVVHWRDHSSSGSAMLRVLIPRGRRASINAETRPGARTRAGGCPPRGVWCSAHDQQSRRSSLRREPHPAIGAQEQSSAAARFGFPP